MSRPDTMRQPHSATGGEIGLTPVRVLRSEWTKFRSLRSSVITLLAAAAVTIGLAAAFAVAEVARWDHLTAHDKAQFDATQVSLFGVFLAQLAVGVLGVLIMSGEYGTGMIRSTMTAVPRRLPVLWAKAAVAGAVTLLVMAPAAIAAFFLDQAILASKHLNVPFSHPGTARAVLGSALYLTVIALLSLGLGTILRHTAAGIAAMSGLLLVLPLLGGLLPGTWGQHIAKYLPSNAGQAVMTVNPGAASLSPAAGFAYLCLYAALILVAGAVVLRRRDT